MVNFPTNKIERSQGLIFQVFFFLLQTLPVLAEVAGLGIAPFSIKVRHACAQEDRCTHVLLCVLACTSLQFLVARSRTDPAFAAVLLSSFGGIAMSEPGELQAAKAELQRKKNNLRTAIQRHDKLLESSSAESQEALKAELGVAKAKLGVAEAELGVAKEELGVAKEELGVVKAKEDTPEQQSEIVKAEMGVVKAEMGVAKAEMGVAKAEMGVAKAEWDVAIAVYDSEAKTSNPGRLEFLQGQINDGKETYNDSKQAYNDRKITYKRLEGQLSSLDFRAPPGCLKVTWLFIAAFLLYSPVSPRSHHESDCCHEHPNLSYLVVITNAFHAHAFANTYDHDLESLLFSSLLPTGHISTNSTVNQV
jgi:hypothetical protein